MALRNPGVVRPGLASKEILRRFTRGREHPRGVVWFGATSFWGHMRHFFASALATQNIDSRDWMTPDPPHELLSRIAELLGGDPRASTLIEALIAISTSISWRTRATTFR